MQIRDLLSKLQSFLRLQANHLCKASCLLDKFSLRGQPPNFSPQLLHNRLTFYPPVARANGRYWRGQVWGQGLLYSVIDRVFERGGRTAVRAVLDDLNALTCGQARTGAKPDTERGSQRHVVCA